MKKFELTDKHLVEKIYDYLKSFDKFDKLSIKVEEIDVANVELAVEIGDDFKYVENLPHRDGVIGIPESIEKTIDSLSRQAKFFEDVETITCLKLFRKAYRRDRDQCALGETVIDGVKYEFAFVASFSQQCQIAIEIDRVSDGLRHESRISTDYWFDHDELEQTWSKFKKVLDR